MAPPGNREGYLRLARTYEALADETQLRAGAADKPAVRPSGDGRPDASEFASPA
jgi:hypothetical protein